VKANKVLEKLEITRRTLSNYVKSGKIRVVRMDNGFLDYYDGDVEKLEKSVSHENKIVMVLNGNRFEYSFPVEKMETIRRIMEVL
jgi:predicted site-specific integrase-resolvase